MTLPELIVIPAGAGSGKTFALQEQLGQWVLDGRVAPDRIIAVTFTEAAASELRERIKAKLLALGRVSDALKLDKAYISTIHGFGLRVLTEFALDAGYSPRPRLLGEEEEDTLIRLALAQTDKANEITSDLGRYGYKYDFNSGRAREDVFRDTLLRVVALLRSIGPLAESPKVVERAVAQIVSKYGALGTGKNVTRRLRTAVTRLLEEYPQSLAEEFGNTAAAARDLREDYNSLRQAVDSDALDWDWQLWQSLRTLRSSNRRTKLPGEYDALVEAVTEAADALPCHPGPLEKEKNHVQALIAAGQDIVIHYTEAKRKAGLVDYSDMIAMACHLLRAKPDVLNTLVSRVDCMVVDEFQDTNPLQFDFLWQLKTAGVPTTVVGDMKQAIMGFQGADPQLFEQIIEQHREDSKPLTQNWRSENRLMGIINQIGKGLFGGDYVSLEPTQGKGLLDPLEVLAFPARPKSGVHAFRADAVGKRLTELLSDPSATVLDRRSKDRRRLRGSDIAVLCPTHPMLGQYADRLRGLGLKVRLLESGWFESPIVQIIWHALAYVANPGDRHAALYLAISELGSKSLQGAIEELMAQGAIDEPLLRTLDNIQLELHELSIYAAVDRVLEAIDVYGLIQEWPDAQQERANCLRFQAESGEFMDANREALASAGYYGSGIQSFLGWLSSKVRNQNSQPDPTVIDDEAVVLSTWHSSKGKEWPIVAVCGLDKKVSASLPSLALNYGSFDDLSNLLSEAMIGYRPNFDAPETNEKFLAELLDDSIIEAKRLIYVAITRPREKLILEWPLYLEKSSANSLWSVLAEAADIQCESGKLTIGGAGFPCPVQYLSESEEIDGQPIEAKLPAYGRRAIQFGIDPTPSTPDSITPSKYCSQRASKRFIQSELHRYSEGLSVKVNMSGRAYGTLLHQCVELLSMKPESKDDLPHITGIEIDDSDLTTLERAVSEFNACVGKVIQPERVEYEVPILAGLESGSFVSGTVDMLAYANEGVWIIDHKSDRPDPEIGGLQKYARQLECYADALSAMGERVHGIGIHWISDGTLELSHAL